MQTSNNKYETSTIRTNMFFEKLFSKQILASRSDPSHTPRQTERQYGMPIRNANMERQYGTPIWNANMERQYGTPIWNASTERQYGTPVRTVTPSVVAFRGLMSRSHVEVAFRGRISRSRVVRCLGTGSGAVCTALVPLALETVT